MHIASHNNGSWLGRDPLQGLTIPPELGGNLQRHREHLRGLVSTLRSAGMKQEQIEDSVSVIADSYKAELIRTIKELVT